MIGDQSSVISVGRSRALEHGRHSHLDEGGCVHDVPLWNWSAATPVIPEPAHAGGIPLATGASPWAGANPIGFPEPAHAGGTPLASGVRACCPNGSTESRPPTYVTKQAQAWRAKVLLSR